jgi:hypothetical protein
MTQETQPENRVHCWRVGRSLPADEHRECPYCFGRDGEKVEAGEHKGFCDYDAEKDPIVFGFPKGPAE